MEMEFRSHQTANFMESDPSGDWIRELEASGISNLMEGISAMEGANATEEIAGSTTEEPRREESNRHNGTNPDLHLWWVNGDQQLGVSWDLGGRFRGFFHPGMVEGCPDGSKNNKTCCRCLEKSGSPENHTLSPPRGAAWDPVGRIDSRDIKWGWRQPGRIVKDRSSEIRLRKIITDIVGRLRKITGPKASGRGIPTTGERRRRTGRGSGRTWRGGAGEGVSHNYPSTRVLAGVLATQGSLRKAQQGYVTGMERVGLVFVPKLDP
ncbi:hypothetical protein WN55_06862 [Dufourea novaeangliae]|uniref:Uncharacterized protein n=1 Tax=Dufourea novaeangliae TaxID=178035 RepID=A0A154PT09_DUFNO|nr:hypothetical protein WN55_06862 [Dufourea novaeangliae]